MQFPFAHTSSFFAVYGLALFYLLFTPDKVRSRKALMVAFALFLLAVVIGVVFTPFRAVETEERARDLIDIWAHGVTWMVVGLSLAALPWAVLDLRFDPLNLGSGVASAPPVRSRPGSPRKEIPSKKKAKQPEPEEEPEEEPKAEVDRDVPIPPLDPGSDVGAVSEDDLTASDLDFTDDLQEKGIIEVNLESDVDEVPEEEEKKKKRKKRR